MFIPVIAAVGVLAWWKAPSQKTLTAEHRVIFESAMTDLTDSTKLRELAKAFDEFGAKAEAACLRKRARLADLPPEHKAARKDAFRKAMRSTNPADVEEMASLFERDGATGAAGALRRYASGLRAAASIPKGPRIEVTPPEKEEPKAEEPKPETPHAES